MRFPGFVPELTLQDLGIEAAFLVFGFRACARGQNHCCVVVRGFQSAFDSDARAALDDMQQFARLLGRDAKRKITVGLPGCVGVTADELCLVEAFADAQMGDLQKRTARLDWLFCGAEHTAATQAMDRLAAVFAAHGLWIKTRETSLQSDQQGKDWRVDLRLVASAGTA